MKKYYLSPNEKTLFYINEEDQLFLRNLFARESQLITENVINFEVHDDLVLYNDKYNDIYLQKVGTNDKELIGNYISPYCFTSDGAIVFRNSDGDLYIKDIGKEKSKIASDVVNFSMSNDVIAYYTKSNELYFGPLNNIQRTIDYVGEYSLIRLGNNTIYQNKVSYEDIVGIWKNENQRDYYKFIEFTADKRVIINSDKPRYADVSIIRNDTEISLKVESEGSFVVTPYFNSKLIDISIAEMGTWKFSPSTYEERYDAITMENDKKRADYFIGRYLNINSEKAQIYNNPSINSDYLGYLIYGDDVFVESYTFDNDNVWLKVRYLNKTDNKYYPAWINTKEIH